MFNITRATTRQLQWLIWILVYLISFCSFLPIDGPYKAPVYALVHNCFYALIIYGNINFLYPRFYERNRKKSYITLAFLLLTVSSLTTVVIFNRYFSTHPGTLTLSSIFYYYFTGVLIFLLSFIFRIAIAYYGLKQKTEEILAQKTAAELNLLKSQVQPHFLFNTLNNIYYEAYLESPGTASLIERLSGIMRYFVEESPKAAVLIETEVQFLEHYIELEKIRIKPEITLNFIKDYPDAVKIPPMLMMTLVENIFKHGVDKSSDHIKIEISLICKEGQLIFKTENSIVPREKESSGFGIENLKRRLSLIYGDQFEFFIRRTEQLFMAGFKIPIP